MGILKKIRDSKKGGSQPPKRPPEPAVEPPVVSAPQTAPQAVSAPAPESTRAYERDLEERQREEAEKGKPVTLHKESVQRIFMGGILQSSSIGTEMVSTGEAPECDGGHAHGYVWGLGKRPRHVRGVLGLVGKDGEVKKDDGDYVYQQLMEKLPLLRSHSVADGESPYRDKDGRLVEFTSRLFDGIKKGNLISAIERVIDTRPFMDMQTENLSPRRFRSPLSFVLNPDFMPPDELLSAGAILGQDGRICHNPSTGGTEFAMAHVFEPYLLAAAALRSLGYEAYVSRAVMPIEGGHELYHPLISVVDLNMGAPLTTFDLIRGHPPLGSIDVMSDVAVLGVTYAMLAEARVKHLTVEMVKQVKEYDKELSLDELENQCERIARMLFECYRRWPGCHFIGNTFIYMHKDLQDAMYVIDYMKHERANGEGLAQQIGYMVRNVVGSNMDPSVMPVTDGLSAAVKEMAMDVVLTSQNLTNHVRVLFDKRVAKAEAASQQAG